MPGIECTTGGGSAVVGRSVPTRGNATETPRIRCAHGAGGASSHSFARKGYSGV